VAGLPDELAALAEAGDERELTPAEVWRLELEVMAACRRVRSARRDRDGHD
jgi:hypothetical protein